ncbi:MAG: hypothetical protein JRN17_03505 [Nitrososphaerota archaeon]|nr:hypothetical protein [Nitrososphaerota archaeon]
MYENIADKCYCGLPYDPKRGLVPRGVTCSTKDTNKVRIIVVGKNPGFPDRLERKRYGEVAGKTYTSAAAMATAMLEATIRWTEEAYLSSQDGKRHPYQTHLMSFLREALGTPRNEEVLSHVYFTELLKCTDKKDERPNLFDTKHLEGTKKCVKRWLLEELKLFPEAKAIVALGHEAEIALMSWTMHPVIYLRHPSSYSKKHYAVALKRLKDVL